MGKGGLFVTPPIEDYFTGLTGSSTQAGTASTDLQIIGSSVADFQALTWRNKQQYKNKNVCQWADAEKNREIHLFIK